MSIYKYIDVYVCVCVCLHINHLAETMKPCKDGMKSVVADENPCTYIYMCACVYIYIYIYIYKLVFIYYFVALSQILSILQIILHLVCH